MNYGTIKNYDIANGTGVRVSLFVSGCRHHCKGCFNSETWDFNYGNPYTKEVEAEILEALKPAYIQGFSLLGGEPFEPENQRALLPFLRRLRRELPEKRVEVKRLSRLAGEPVVFRLKALTYDQTRRVQDKPRGEQAVQAVLLGCVEPDWKDRSLLAPGSVATPIDAIKSKLTAGEIDELYIEIQMLSGYIDRALADVKNA